MLTWSPTSASTVIRIWKTCLYKPNSDWLSVRTSTSGSGIVIANAMTLAAASIAVRLVSAFRPSVVLLTSMNQLVAWLHRARFPFQAEMRKHISYSVKSAGVLNEARQVVLGMHPLERQWIALSIVQPIFCGDCA